MRLAQDETREFVQPARGHVFRPDGLSSLTELFEIAHQQSNCPALAIDREFDRCGDAFGQRDHCALGAARRLQHAHELDQQSLAARIV